MSQRSVAVEQRFGHPSYGVFGYIRKNFEKLFILLVLLVTILLHYYIAAKLSFLNFYFLPIIIAGYFLGARKAILGALLSFLYVSLYAINYPDVFIQQNTSLTVYLNIAMWGGFLMLAGAVVGKLQDRISEKVIELNQANLSLRDYSENLEAKVQERTEELDKANEALRGYAEDLESKVKERTHQLEESNQAIASLKRKVEETLFATMDPSVVNLLVEGRLRNEKRELSVLFADLVGFTTYSERHPPEVVVGELNRYIHDTEPILLTYRGHIDKYMGDGIMCEFGAPLNYDTHRLLAVICAIKLQELVAKGDYPWQLRIAVSSGSAVTGLIGSKRQTYTAIGDIVNVAARLETCCEPGRILIDGYTYEDVGRFIDAKRMLDVPVGEMQDPAKEHELAELQEKLRSAGDDPGIYHQIGKIHLELKQYNDARYYFERALRLDPSNDVFKLIYAETDIQIKDREKIGIKGKRQRVAAFEVEGIKDPFLNGDKIPVRFYEEFKTVENLIPLPMDLAWPVEALDGTIGHSKIVALVAYALTTRLYLPDNEKLEILLAGFLSDLGKEIVPFQILNRRGGLTTAEFQSVREHPVESSRILRKMGYQSESLIEMVTHSHECMNGTGYPDGLKGSAIPVGSRIIAVADAYDALTSWRPYRDAWDRGAALEEMRRGVQRGLYDPVVVQALVELMS